MKWMIASDIHGSAFYCEKMLKAFKREQADKLLLLGDILYHGPRNEQGTFSNTSKLSSGTLRLSMTPSMSCMSLLPCAPNSSRQRVAVEQKQGRNPLMTSTIHPKLHMMDPGYAVQS